MRPIASQLDGSEEIPTPPPAFPSGGPTPEGKVSLKDVQFDYFNQSVLMRPFSKLSNHLAKNGELVITTFGEKKPVWQGPAGPVEFIEETVAGVHTVKKVLPDGEHIIWSDKAITGSPDLQLQRDADGRSRLLDKQGILLWSGVLKQNSAGGSTRQQGGTSQVKAGGVQIDGVDGMYTVKIVDTSTILWSGRLPLQAVILIRDGHRFHFQSPIRSEGGADGFTRIRFEKEAGAVTITDKNSRELGTRPIAILKVHETMSSEQYPPIRQVRLIMPDGRLTKTGTVFLTYKDSTGRIIRRSKSYKDGNFSGTM